MAWRDSRGGLEALADPELAATLDAVAAQHRRGLITSWLVCAKRLRARGTPLRTITKFGDGVGRLQFADQSALLIDTSNPSGRLMGLILALGKGQAVLVSDIHDDGERFVIRLRWAHKHVDVEVVGGDQPT